MATLSTIKGFLSTSIQGDVVITNNGTLIQRSDAITHGRLIRTTDGASQLHVEFADSTRDIISKSDLNYNTVPVLATLDGLTFSLVQVKKSLSILRCVFEPIAVWWLRQQGIANGPTPGPTPATPTSSLAQGITSIVTNGLTLVATSATQGGASYTSTMSSDGSTAIIAIAGPPAITFKIEAVTLSTPISGGSVTQSVAKSMDFNRGTPTNPYEDTWSCLLRLATATGRRVFESESTVYFGSDSWLLRYRPVGLAPGEIQEFTNLVSNIDCDWDVGKPLSELTVTATTALWPYPPGSVVMPQNMPLLQRNWIVSECDRNWFDQQCSVTLNVPGNQLLYNVGAVSL